MDECASIILMLSNTFRYLDGGSRKSCNTIMNNDIRENRVYGVHVAFASNNEIKENNFIMNNRSAYFQGIQLNSWSNNYWCYSISGSKMKIIFGRVICFPWLNFDWNPASEPYVIGGE